MNLLDTEKRDIGKEFEEEVKIFLKDKLGFSDVKGGPDFHIAPAGQKNQIDACGRYKDILFVFECKAAGRRVKKSLRKDILENRSKMRMVIDRHSYRNIPEYKNCNFVVFIFITKKIELSETEKNLFKDNINPKIWYEDENLLEYYSDLNEKIGDYAIYNFLTDYGIHPSENEQLTLTSIRTKLGNYQVYNFYARPKDLLKFTYVARRRSLKEEFYQRMLDKSRINKIQKFLDNGGIFPTNIIISLRGGDKEFKKISCEETLKDCDVGILNIKNSYNACWIVDGQHRLYSFARSKSNDLVSCIAFDEITIEDERRFFLEINREQKPIQPDLIWDLDGLANPDSSRGIISNIVRTLNNREPFMDKIYIPVKGSKSGKWVNMAAFCNGIVNASLTKDITSNCIGIKNPLYTSITKTITNRVATVLGGFFSLLDKNLKEEYKNFVFGNAGIPIILYVLEPIIARIGRIPGLNDLEKYALTTASFFEENYPNTESIKKLREGTTGEGARRNCAKQIGFFIRTNTKDKDFWPTMEKDESVEEIILMERRIANFIAANLFELSVNWESQKVPQPIYTNAKKRMEQDGVPFEENLSLGDELQIITRKDNWEDVFEEIFITKDGFQNQEELKLAFNYLSKIRNPQLHGKSTSINKEDLSLCDIYLLRFSRVVPERIS